MPTIEEIAEELNRRSVDYEIGKLQEIRRRQKEIEGLRTKKIFVRNRRRTAKGYTFHWGGREEFQFNIGWDDVDGGRSLRHGAAFSLEPSRSLPEADLLPLFIPKIDRFNEYVRECPGKLDGFRIWAYVKTDPSPRRGPYRACEIPDEWVQSGTFIFVGGTGSVESPDYDEILCDFDRLFSVYRYVERIDKSPVASRV